jgi:hypothetical protein
VTRRARWAAAVGAVAAVAALPVVAFRPLPTTGPAPSDGYARLSGIVHAHTTLSDGGGRPEEVVQAAAREGLQFLVLTDHNTLAAKPLEGYQQGVLVVVGTEISTDAGHLLGIGIPDPGYRFSGDVRDGLEDIQELGGIAFAAHPLSPKDGLRWTAWDLPGPWGVEVLSNDSEWRTASRARLAETAALYLLNPRYALLRDLTAPREVLSRWDRLLAERPCPGIAGADAHGRLPVLGFSLPVPSYRAVFGLAQTHVLLHDPPVGDAEADRGALVAALQAGHAYIGVDSLASAREFSFLASRGDESWTMGDTVPGGPHLTLRAGGRMPQGATVRLLKDGQPWAEGAGAVERSEVPNGIYRVEVSVRGFEVPWVLSNAISVVDHESEEARALRATLEKEATAPAPALLVDPPGRTSFHPEHDPGSSIAEPLWDPRGGPEGAPSLRLAFALSGKATGTWCALVDREPRDWTGRHGLVLSVKADGEYRFWLQVRDVNPASTEDGLEWWFASVRARKEWTRVALPFSRFRSISAVSDGRLDLDKVRAVVAMVDPSCLPPGSRGTILLSGLGVY